MTITMITEIGFLLCVGAGLALLSLNDLLRVDHHHRSPVAGLAVCSSFLADVCADLINRYPA